VSAEKRATFRCTPGLQRPPASIAPGLWAAGDYVDGPYPATLEGAVLSGRQAAHSLPSPSETTRHAPADTEMQSDIPQCRTAQRPPQWPS
jgi:uncharacterized protein with NAD-binding domain and iron-sulfur cluster